MEAINNLQENILDCVNLSVPTVVSQIRAPLRKHLLYTEYRIFLSFSDSTGQQ